MTAFTTVPFLTCPSGDASFTLAVMVSPRPARNPVEPPSGKIICSLRAPELSATSSQLLIINAIIQSPCMPAAVKLLLLLPYAPAPTRSCGQFPSSASASTSKAAATLRAGQHRRRGPGSFHHGHRTFCPWKPRARRKRATSCAPLRRRSFSSCGWKPLRQPLPCAALRPPGPAVGLSRALLLLRFAGCNFTFAGDRLHARDVLAQAAHLLQTFGLSHVELELQLEELTAQVTLLMLQFFVGQVANFFRFHNSVLSF